MQDLEGIVGRTRERVCLDLEVNTTHNLTTWALPNELTDYPVSYGGVIRCPCLNCVPPLSYQVVIALVAERRGLLSAPPVLALFA